MGQRGVQELHTHMTFQFISAKGKGLHMWGTLSIPSTAGSSVMKSMLSGQGNKIIAYFENPT